MNVDVVLVSDDALVLVRNDRDLDYILARNDRDLDLVLNCDDDERPYNKHCVYDSNVYLYEHKMMIHNCSFQYKTS